MLDPLCQPSGALERKFPRLWEYEILTGFKRTTNGFSELYCKTDGCESLDSPCQIFPKGSSLCLNRSFQSFMTLMNFPNEQ